MEIYPCLLGMRSFFSTRREELTELTTSIRRPFKKAGITIKLKVCAR